MKAAVLQMNSGANVQANVEQAAALVQQAAHLGASLALLPENFALMAAQETDKLVIAEAPGHGPLQAALTALAVQHQITIVAGTLPLFGPNSGQRVYAASLVFTPEGQCAGRYDKIHLFDVDLGKGEAYRESRTIAPGPPNPVTVPCNVGLLGLSVCYDLRFPELYRALAASGATLLTVPSAFTATTGTAHWHTLLRARAIENQCFVLAANQVGQHPGERSTYGHSIIYDPWGDVLAEVKGQHPGVAVAEISYSRLQDIRRRVPALNHRRL